MGNWAAAGKDHCCFQLLSVTGLFWWNGFKNGQVQLCSIPVTQETHRLVVSLAHSNLPGFYNLSHEIKTNSEILFSFVMLHNTLQQLVEIFKWLALNWAQILRWFGWTSKAGCWSWHGARSQLHWLELELLALPILVFCMSPSNLLISILPAASGGSWEPGILSKIHHLCGYIRDCPSLWVSWVV